jgi:hypothetical protein
MKRCVVILAALMFAVVPFAEEAPTEAELFEQFETLLDQLGETSKEALAAEVERLGDLVSQYDSDKHSPFAGGDVDEEWELVPVRLVFAIEDVSGDHAVLSAGGPFQLAVENVAETSKDGGRARIEYVIEVVGEVIPRPDEKVHVEFEGSFHIMEVTIGGLNTSNAERTIEFAGSTIAKINKPVELAQNDDYALVLHVETAEEDE